jgi:hypothetical protein
LAVELADVDRLVSGEGWGLLQSLPPYDESTALALGSRLRAAGFDAALVAAALSQSRLRARAAAKFGEFAGAMLFTPDGLEQATRLEVAARHAERFRSAGVRTVHDLGCGIGSDAMALAGLDLHVDAVDADEVTAAVAGVNLRHWPEATTAVGRAEDVPLPRGRRAQHVGAWLDPARRLPGVHDAAGRTRRVFALSAMSPSWQTVKDIAERLPATAAKLSPAFPHSQVPAGAEAQWTSYGGEVVECTLWWGPLTATPGRSAMVLAPGRPAVTVRESDSVVVVPCARHASDLQTWLYEPDRAVLRAGLTGALTSMTGGVELDPGVGYVTSDAMVDVPYAKRFLIGEAMPFNVKALRAWLRDRDVGNLTVKKRGVFLDADVLRRQLRLTGSQAQLMVVTRVAGQQTALMVRPA